MRVLVAMSGGVDSSVAAACCLEAGDEVVGATMKLWGGESDSGCCSVADVTDARRVCDQLGIEHFVFNFTDRFEEAVVGPYADAHVAGRTPNPCVECNRHIKFDAFLERALRLGFDAIATGHHARVVEGDGSLRIARGADADKDQSYVLAVLGSRALSKLCLPVGEMTKATVREKAAAIGLRTATKPDSQDVCFVARSAGGRGAFLSSRIELHEGDVVDLAGERVGRSNAIELVTVGQRKGLGLGGGPTRFALRVDVEARRVVVGEEAALRVGHTELEPSSFVGELPGADEEVVVQVSAHGAPRLAHLRGGVVEYSTPERSVAPGQLVAWYRGDAVLGSATAR